MMTYVVTANCIKCKYQDCVTACPVMCFHEGPEFIVIDPNQCVDCGVCVGYCPINAIRKDTDLMDDEKIFEEINLELSKKWPVIESKGEIPLDADAWVGVSGKLKYLDKVLLKD